MAARDDKPGVIEPGRLYVVSEARERMRAGPTTWQRLIARGLRVTKVGAKSYVLGDDLIKAIAEGGKEGAVDGKGDSR